MCGIVGAAAVRNVVPVLLDGLKRLEYRGYDSAGIAVTTYGGGNQDESAVSSKLSRNNSVNDASSKAANKPERNCDTGIINLVRSTGKVQKLVQEIINQPIQGSTGIAHTRWATHGKPCEENAHPHAVGERIAIVHNGIIENYVDIYQQLQTDNKSYERQSETDTEIIAAWVYQRVIEGKSLLTAVMEATKILKGAYAIALLDAMEPDCLVAARQGSPLVIGVGIDEYFLASDPLALQKVAQDFIYLEDGDVALIKHNKLEIYDAFGNSVTGQIHEKRLTFDAAEKGEYRHFMYKEIFEQPRAVVETLLGRIHNGMIMEQAFGRNAATVFAATEHVQIVACGTSFYAGMMAKYWLEEFAGVACSVEVASEFRYRKRKVLRNTLFVTLSQSGETADTLAALKSTTVSTATATAATAATATAANTSSITKDANVKADSCVKSDSCYLARLAICNVPESSLVRESDMVFLTHAGPEVGVASTKAFMTQLVALLLLTFAIAKSKNKQSNDGLSLKQIEDYVAILAQAPKFIEEILQLDRQIEALAKRFIDKEHALFLGRGSCYPLALEGALKLKEISYIHAEAYPAGELKHGPLALVDSAMPVVVLVPQDELFDKIKANIAAVAARGGQIIVIAPIGCKVDLQNVEYLHIPQVPNILVPLIMTVPMQLLAYYVAVAKGTDVDHPRNLAKSVTVE